MDDTTQELTELYAEASQNGFFIKEFLVPNGYLAAVGNEMPEVDIDQLEGAVIDVSAPGFGTTREEAVREALTAWKNYQSGIEEE